MIKHSAAQRQTLLLQYLRLPGYVLLMFIVLNTLLRIGLAAFGTEHDFSIWQMIKFLGTGLLYDTAVGLCFALPAALVTALWPSRFPRAFRIWSAIWWMLLCAIFLLILASEVVFWNEFGSRFNFIAVDYLIYTREVLGNIRESYPMGKILSVLAVTAILLSVALWRWWQPANQPLQNWRWRGRSAFFVSWLFAAVIALTTLDARWKEIDNDTRVVQLAGNGVFEFMHAFRNNEIDYAQFYRTIPMARAVDMLRGEFHSPAERTFMARENMPIQRKINSGLPEQKLNVVMITVESLSAAFLGTFGNQENLTPELDKLAKESLLFTQLYATGLRTVRGLEALSLSIPPTPGHSVVKRQNNDNLYTLGEIFATKGYEPLFIYGGYGYFDNMNGFFSGNGYTVLDRTALKKEEISYENIWGVADEDLYKLTLRALDERHAKGKPFFAQLMTTSNHRPFGFPANRIDLPTGNRAGAVKYTDWAIGQFIKAARQRPWFDNTVFVIVADHCAEGRGKMNLTVENFHIPLLIYSPKHIKAERINTIASQIDVPPTLLGLLNFSYTSNFFGQNILTDGKQHQRALMANYQTVGYWEDGRLVELQPKGKARVLNPQDGSAFPMDQLSQYLVDEAVSYYEIASEAFKRGGLKKELVENQQPTKP